MYTYLRITEYGALHRARIHRYVYVQFWIDTENTFMFTALQNLEKFLQPEDATEESDLDPKESEGEGEGSWTTDARTDGCDAKSSFSKISGSRPFGNAHPVEASEAPASEAEVVCAPTARDDFTDFTDTDNPIGMLHLGFTALRTFLWQRTWDRKWDFYGFLKSPILPRQNLVAKHLSRPVVKASKRMYNSDLYNFAKNYRTSQFSTRSSSSKFISLQSLSKKQSSIICNINSKLM